MAREDKHYGVRPVDEPTEAEETIVRLGTADGTRHSTPLRLVPESAPEVPSQRLDVPNRDDFETRTHEPGIEALIEHSAVDPDLLERDWGEEAVRNRNIPWGWFALIGVVLAGAVVWSLGDVKESEEKAKQIVEETADTLEKDAEEEQEASELVERIETVSRNFFRATRVEELEKFVRQPERVRPLMDAYYKERPITPVTEVQTQLLQPVTLENRANFWMKSVETEDGKTRNMIVEVLESGEPKIDWETLVCHQPMDWDVFARDRPAGTSMDFRVFIEPDRFFSHEFADQSQWDSFRLTAFDSDETLFGYAKTGGGVSKEIQELIGRNGGGQSFMILRLLVPEGIQSRRGVVIEKVICPRWIYLDPPKSGS